MKNFGIDTFPEWRDAVQRSETPVILDEQAWRDIQIPDDHAGKTPETVCYGRSVAVWPSAALMRMEKRFWNKREDYDTQINIIYPTIVCPTCSSRHPDGVVNCIECSTRLEPHTDQSMITDYMREREDAVRKNRQTNPMLLAPSAGINRNRQRVRFEGQEEQRETISAASALRNKCKQMIKRADQRGLGSLADIVDNPIDACNTSRVGLSVSSLQELATFANIRLPDISQRAKGGAGKHGAHQIVDARMAYVWPPNERQLDLLTKCLVSFQDRCNELDEIAILIFAAIKSNKILGFLILDFAGNVKEFVGDKAVVQIMAELADLFLNNIPRAASRNEPRPELMFDGELRIPEGFASLGDRQLNAIMANTRFFRHYTRNTMESWFDRAQSIWMADVPPPPPTGRSGRTPYPPAAPATSAPKAQTSASSSSGGPTVTIPPFPPAGRRGRSRTPTDTPDFAAMREGRPFEPSAAATKPADHDGYPGPVTRKAPPEPVAKAAKAARIELPGVVVQKAPPAPKTAKASVPQPPPQPKAMPKPTSSNVAPKVASKVPPIASPLQMQERQDLLDDRLRYIALHGQSTIDIRDDFSIRHPMSRDGGVMDPNSQGANFDWLDRYL